MYTFLNVFHVLCYNMGYFFSRVCVGSLIQISYVYDQWRVEIRKPICIMCISNWFIVRTVFRFLDHSKSFGIFLIVLCSSFIFTCIVKKHIWPLDVFWVIFVRLRSHRHILSCPPKSLYNVHDVLLSSQIFFSLNKCKKLRYFFKLSTKKMYTMYNIKEVYFKQTINEMSPF